MLFLDFFSTVKIVENVAQYTGGTNYVKRVAKLIKLEAISRGVKVKVIIPEKFIIIAEDEKDLFSGEWCELVRVSSLEECDYEEAKVLFLPQVNGTLLSEVPKIKSLNPQMKIVGTLHDRQHNCFSYDWYNRYYYSGVRRLGIFDLAKFYMKKIYFDLMYPYWIKNFDMIFTDSNYSLQMLEHKNVKDIKYFYIGNLLGDFEESVELYASDEYALMVGAGREEKNLLRTLEAYTMYRQRNTNSKLKLYVTGVSEELMNRLYKAKKKCLLYKDDIVCNKYVSYFELNELYRNCKFVIFPSKAEGFGLPVLEALMRGKVVLASRVTSTPEVIGACAKYMNPYDVESICNGMAFLDNDINIQRYKKYISKKIDIVNKQVELDDRIFIDEIFGIL